VADRKLHAPGDPERYPYKGQHLTIEELSDLSRLPVAALLQHIKARGMTAEEAIEKETITHDGQTLTINEWVQVLDIPRGRLLWRLRKWPKEYALRKEKRPLDGVRDLRWMVPETPEGPVKRTMKEWSELLGIPMSTISRRLERGWNDTQALNFAPGPKELKKRNTENA
jgi:hypothetical protein